jgi:hypothetical protein
MPMLDGGRATPLTQTFGGHANAFSSPAGVLSPHEAEMSELNLELLSRKARKATACSYCFMDARATEWPSVPQRPVDRPDDVAFPPWIGRRYSDVAPRVTVMMLNPGHKPAPHKLTRRDLGHQLRNGDITYDLYNSSLARLVPEWGFGGVVRWLEAIELEPERICFLNMALCAVANDDYFPELFETCFKRHTRDLLAVLKPHVVLLCGKKQLRPYTRAIESLGASVILTWHYRPMHTSKGRAELQRVRAELKKLM